MPVYEFACRDCQKTFEIVRPMSESSSANVTCAQCGSIKVERLLEHRPRGHIEEKLRADSPCGRGTPGLPLSVDVECYAGYQAQETPRRFGLAGPRFVLLKLSTAGWLPITVTSRCRDTTATFTSCGTTFLPSGGN